MLPPAFRVVSAALGALALFTSAALAQPKLSHSRPAPNNIFLQGNPINFLVGISGFPSGSGTVAYTVKNYDGSQVASGSITASKNSGDGISAPLPTLSGLDAGYYEITSVANWNNTAGGTTTATVTTAFGISAQFSTRTAAQNLSGNYRFGLKTFSASDQYAPSPTWKLGDAATACANLGLQWTRHLFNDQNTGNYIGDVTTASLTNTYRMNTVMKVENFPASCYDDTRYGPMASFEATYGVGSWKKKTVPKKAEYQAWLATELNGVLASQNVFEIANEPWNQPPLTGAEFAEIMQMNRETIKAVRPTAIVGANLGEINWDRAVIAAGGLNGFDMVTLHPYSFTPLPETRTRAYIRNYADFVKKRLPSSNIDLYTTEYGWSTAPSSTNVGAVGPDLQAQRVVRQSLMLYAEGLKTLIPHAMGDREDDPTNWDAWFGFFHRNGEPRPVVLAFATCARMIDGGTYVGDINYGPGVGAMLYLRGGVYTLALWSDEVNHSVTVNTGVSSVTKVGFTGGTQTVATTGGSLALTLTGQTVYLQGVSSSLAALAIPVTEDLNADTWSTRVGTFTMVKAATPPVIDGNLADWAGAEALPLLRSGVNGGTAYLRWDANYVYAAATFTDANIIGAAAGQAITTGDAFELRLGARPSRQLDLGGWNIYDYSFIIAPTSSAGTPALRVACDNWDTPIVNPPFTGDPSGLKWAAVTTAGVWKVEIAIPRTLMTGFPAMTAGSKVSAYLRALDKDTSGGSVLTYEYMAAAATRLWPYLVLAEDTTEVILDNASPTGVTLTGAWVASTNQAGYYGSNYLHDNAANKGTMSVRFNPALASAGSYQVYARWTSGSNRANNVPIDVTGTNGTFGLQVDETVNGQQWVSLGVFQFNAGTGGNVVFSNTGTAVGKYMTVDAVRFVKVAAAAEVIKDNTDASGVAITGTWTTGTNQPGYQGANYIHDGAANKGAMSVKYTPTLPYTGFYKVYARWTSDSNRANNVPVTLDTADGLENLVINETTGGGTWYSLGTYAFDAGTGGYALISNTGTAAGKYVIADAFKFVLQ